MTRHLLLIRHAETALAGTFCGTTDPALNAAGEAQTEALAHQLTSANVTALYTSDLQRAQQTATALGSTLGLTPIPVPGLREIGFGAWEALTWSQIEARDPERASHWLRDFPNGQPPEGEPFAAFEARVLSALEQVLAAGHETAATVSHAGPIRVMLKRLASTTHGRTAWQTRLPYASVQHLARTSANAPWELLP